MDIVIAHASWMQERKATLARLLEQVPQATVLSSVRREHAATWARRAWEYVAAQDGPVCILNDDVTVCPEFSKVLDVMAAAAPGRALSLHTSAPDAAKLSGSSWARVYWYSGPAVVLYPDHARSLLDFWSTLPHSFGPNEDNVAIAWAWARQEPFWSSIPAVVTHDTATKSSLGYDNHPLRSSCVSWENQPHLDLTSPEYWRRGAEAPPFVENPWAKAGDLEHTRRTLAAPGPTCESCWSRKALLRLGTLAICPECLMGAVCTLPKRYKLFVATPYRADGVQPEYVKSVLELQKILGLEVQHEMSLSIRHEHQDLVRVRSRMLRIANEQGAYLLFADGDNAWDPKVVVSMLKSGKDFVQCPYLRRDGRGYTIRPTEKDRTAGRTAPEDIQPDGTIEIEHTGLGLTLISPTCMQRMLAAYGSTGLDFQDLDRDSMALTKTTALFQLLFRDGALLSEDTSFATRWRDIGGKVWLFIGDGSPIAHYGQHKYQGSIEDLGFTRAKT